MSAGPILVTGAGGFCGAAIAAALAAAGSEVVGTVRPGRRSAVAAAGVRLVPCDLAAAGAIEALVARIRPSRCVHAAAVGARERCDDLDLLLGANIRATAALVGALAAAGARRVVTLGSSSEYGSPDGAMAETMVPAPDDLYGVSKLAAGLAAHAIGRARGIETVHLRLFSVYGPGEAPGRLVPSVLRAVVTGVPIDLTGGRQVRDLVYVADVADAVLHGLASPLAAGGTYNVGTGIETSVRDLALLACRVTDADPSLLRFGALAYRAGERFSWHADTARAAAIGWRAATTLEEGVAATVAAFHASVGAAA